MKSTARKSHKIITIHRDGMHNNEQSYKEPVLANPGNVFRVSVGGGKMGHPLAHDNEAPFPESIVKPFILSLCPPGGLVLDPFSGSGTTMAVCAKLGRSGLGIDLRESQTKIGMDRLSQVQ
jgi:DNA modification methylase